jgi:hypothetical protein
MPGWTSVSALIRRLKIVDTDAGIEKLAMVESTKTRELIRIAVKEAATSAPRLLPLIS